MSSNRSQFRCGQSMWHFTLLWLILVIGMTEVFDYKTVHVGEGCASTMGSTRITAPAAFSPTDLQNDDVMKQHGKMPRKEQAPASCVRKRSYRRAVKRAVQHGYSWYRGRILTPSQLSATHIETVTSDTHHSHIPTPTQSHTPKGQRFCCFSWNVGGLSLATWDALQLWFSSQDWDVIHLQETHWRHTSTWTQRHYYCLHDGCDKGGGLLTLISRKFCTMDEVTWHSVVPGRLQHIRIHVKGRNLDLLNCYQHVRNHLNTESRNQYWQALNDTLSSIPNRNLLLLSGDLNTSVTKITSSVGVDSFFLDGRRVKGPKASDESTFTALLKQYDLVMVNTRSHLAGPTFTSHLGSSRIDYICTRRIHADGWAKQVQHLEQMPMVPESGPRHYPLVTTLKRQWYSSQQLSSPGWTAAHRTRLRQHWKAADSTWDSIQQTVVQHLEETTPDLDVNDFATFHSDLTDKVRALVSPSLFSRPDHTLNGFQALLCHKRQLHALNQCTIATVFQSWKLLVHIRKDRMLLRQHSNLRRKERRQALMRQARLAANARDQYTLFAHIRRITPKTPRRQFRLRGPQGELLSPSEAADSIAEWLHATYNDAESFCTSTPIQAYEWPFDRMALFRNFRTFDNNKALDPDFIPSLLWKQFADDFATFMHQCASQWSQLQPPKVPSLWSRGTLFLLNKPNKKSDTTDSLRPIALLEPTGKSVMGALAEFMRGECQQHFTQLPQFAYMQNRGCNEAIGRVLNMIDGVLHRLSQLQYKHHPQVVPTPPNTVIGGIIVSLDLSKAFDCVNRCRLYTAMEDFGIPFEQIQLLQSIYSNTEYRFTHRGVERCIRTTKGIRQGCKAAPGLWLVYLGHLMNKLAGVTSWQWLQVFNTVFADDWTFHADFSNVAELENHLTKVGVLFDLLDQYGLQLNVSKTVALMKAAGPDLRKLNRKFVHRNQNGTFLVIPRQGKSPTHIRLVQQHMYLGICLKFGAYQLQTMKHRLHCAKNVSYLLNKWLRGKGGLSRQQKVRLWLQCVFSSLCHGLSHVGAGIQHLYDFDSWCMTQIRHLHQKPVHLDRMTHSSFLQFNRITDPLLLLRRRLQSVLQRETERATVLTSQDILANWTSHRTFTFLEVLDKFIQLRRSEFTLQPRVFFECIYCDVKFPQYDQLRRHYTRHHHLREGPMRIYHPSLDVESGVPTCIRCKQSFTSWANLRKHVEMVCIHDRPQVMPQEDFRSHQQIFRKFAGQDLENLPVQTDVLERFRKRCALCNHYATSDKQLKHHWKADHSVAYVAHDDLYTDLFQQASSLMPTEMPCTLCGKQNKRAIHDCMILRNLALLAAEDDFTEIPVHATPDRLHRCQYCEKTFLTANGLQMHLHKRHDEVFQGKIPFLVERDCLPNATACAHCGQAFETMTSVERHIKSGTCPDFDPDLPVTTLMNNNQNLKTYVEQDRLQDLLADGDLMTTLYLTCGLCAQKFKFRGNLGNHFASRHATLVNVVKHEVQRLESVHRGSSFKCFCPVDRKSKEARTHRCVIFQQYAMMRHYVHTQNLGTAPLTPDPTADLTLQTLGALCDESDGETNSGLQSASLVCEAMEISELDNLQDEQLRVRLLQTMVRPSEAPPAIDPLALNFLSLPSYSQPLIIHDDVISFVNSSFIIDHPTAVHHVAKGDYLALWRDLNALYFMSRFCVCCDRHFFRFEDVEQHMKEHWMFITQLPADYYQQCANDFFQNFIQLPWFQNTACYRAVLHQILVLRLIFELWANGSPRPRNDGNMECRFTERRVSAGLQSPETEISRRPSKVFRTSSAQAERSSTRQASRSRSRSKRSAGDAVETNSQARRYAPDSLTAAPVHLALEDRSGESHSFDDGKKPAVACGKDQSQQSSQSLGLGDDHNTEGKSGEDAFGHSQRRELQDVAKTTIGDRRPEVSLLELEPPKEAACPQQGQTTGGAGALGLVGSDHFADGRSTTCASLPFHEKTPTRSGPSDGQRVSMDAYSDTVTPCIVSEAMLSQYLATRGCRHEASNSREESVSKADCRPCEKRTLNICLNAPHLYCWLNSVCLALGWMGLTVAADSDEWINKCWALRAITTFGPTPIALYHGDATFIEQLQDWVKAGHCWNQQQDAGDFMHFLLPVVAPAFFSGFWIPKWVADKPEDVANTDEKGAQFSPILISVDLPVQEHTIQGYISHWFDLNGHQRLFPEPPKGTCIQLSRLRHEPSLHTDNSEIFISDHVQLPCLVNHEVSWISYTVIAVTYHIGASYNSGHWRTCIWQGSPFHRWLNYDDSVLPELAPQLPKSIHTQWTMIWLARDPSFD